MRRRTQVLRLSLAAAAVALMAGCSVNTKFVYKPDAPTAGGAKLPAKVAVLPFKDGTEDFVQRGSVWTHGHYNLAKAGINGAVTALTPELWAKSFADDLAASGSFGSARFVYSSSELADEEFFVEGTVKKADWGIRIEDGNEFALALRATRRADNKVLWEKEFARTWNRPRDMTEGCRLGIQCTADRYQGEINNSLRVLFAEARADLVGTVGSLSGGQADGKGVRPVPSVAGEAAVVKPPAPPAPESADQTIERILKGR